MAAMCRQAEARHRPTLARRAALARLSAHCVAPPNKSAASVTRLPACGDTLRNLRSTHARPDDHAASRPGATARGAARPRTKRDVVA
jgi:hypothetical protein